MTDSNQASTAEPTPRVKGRGLSKRFGATQALDDVDFDVMPGEVHALVGENGAGKSTLGKVIGGIYAADEGQLEIEGTEWTGDWNTRRALTHGIAMIQQELSLVPALSVAENVFLGIEHHRFGLLARDLYQRFEDLAEQAGFDVPSSTPVRALPIAARQKVEILRALARDARVVIMDEPTSSLAADETEALHEVIHGLVRQDRSVIYVTHFLEDALAQADRITVMRDGRVVRTARASEETEHTLVEAMLGRPMEMVFPELPPAPEGDTAPTLVLRDVVSDRVHGVSLEVRPGEIFGLAGLVGSGRSELLSTIFGAQPLLGGEILINGETHKRLSPRTSIRKGVALVPEDRREQGLVMTQSVRQNVTLPHLAHFTRGGLVQRRDERTSISRLLDQLQVVPPKVDGDIRLFSGGNQQKVLFAKWMVRPPKVVLLDEPTRGVDVGAKQKIYDVVVELARRGAAVVFVSSELEEVLGLSHRVSLIDQGRLIGEVDPATHTTDDVLYRLFGLDDELRHSTEAEAKETDVRDA